MKIIEVDNFDRDLIRNIIVCEDMTDDYYAIRIVNLLNDAEGENSSSFFKIVDDDF